MNRPLQLRQALSAPCGEIPSQKKDLKFKLSVKPKIGNPKIRDPPQTTI